jgi:hypothetical protein
MIYTQSNVQGPRTKPGAASRLVYVTGEEARKLFGQVAQLHGLEPEGKSHDFDIGDPGDGPRKEVVLVLQWQPSDHADFHSAERYEDFCTEWCMDEAATPDLNGAD